MAAVSPSCVLNIYDGCDLRTCTARLETRAVQLLLCHTKVDSAVRHFRKFDAMQDERSKGRKRML